MARIGTVGYLNARPLSDRIDIDRHTLVLAHPAEVARMLGGERLSNTRLAHAQEMLSVAADPAPAPRTKKKS